MVFPLVKRSVQTTKGATADVAAYNGWTPLFAAAAMLAPPRFQIASMEIRFFVVPNKEWWSGEKNQFNIDLKLLPHFVRLPDCQFHVQGRTGETNGKASKASIS